MFCHVPPKAKILAADILSLRMNPSPRKVETANRVDAPPFSRTESKVADVGKLTVPGRVGAAQALVGISGGSGGSAISGRGDPRVTSLSIRFQATASNRPPCLPQPIPDCTRSGRSQELLPRDRRSRTVHRRCFPWGGLTTDASGNVWQWTQRHRPIAVSSDVPVEVPLKTTAKEVYAGEDLNTNGTEIALLTDGTRARPPWKLLPTRRHRESFSSAGHIRPHP
jgi:hypothetical protein